MLLALVFLCSTLFACGNTANSDREMVISNTYTFLWHDLYFYVAPAVESDKESGTLKYYNTLAEGEHGIPVYNDPFNEDGDPFSPKSSYGSSLATSTKVLIDEDATEKNNGFPVLIAALPFERPEDVDTGTFHYRLVSYNMGTGEMKILCEDVGEEVKTIGLYRDSIYYIGVSETIEDFVTGAGDIENALFVLPKDGGTPKKLPLSIDDTEFSLECTWKGKIYLRTAGKRLLYRYDPETGDAELVSKITNNINQLYLLEPIYYINGYVYYKGNEHVITKEGYSDMRAYDLYRQPLDNLQELNEKNGELILQNIDGRILQGDTKLFYYNVSDGNPIGTWQTDYSIMYCYDVFTKKIELVYDHSKMQGIDWTVWHANDTYVVMDTAKEEGGDYWRNSIVNWYTGERWEIGDVGWRN